MNTSNIPLNSKIAYVIIKSERYGYSWLVTAHNTDTLLAKSRVVYHEKIDAFLAGADAATALGYSPREQW